MGDERAASAKDRKLGQRVRTRRLEIGMSQERLAELLGITFQQVQKYEKGANRIAASRLHDIAAALEMPVARFFEGLGPGKKVSEEPEAPMTSQEYELLRLFRKLPTSKARSGLLDFLQDFVESKKKY